MKNRILTEIELLKSLCGENIEDTSLYNHSHDTDAQLAVIGGFCFQLEMSISTMINIGKSHCLDESEHLLKNITMYYHLCFEDIVRRMLRDTVMTADKINSIIDGITLSHESYDTFYTLAIDDASVDFGDNSLSWLPWNNYQEPTNGNLSRNFFLYEMIDMGTEIEITENGEVGYINSLKYDLANLSRDEKNALLLSMFRTATYSLLGEEGLL